MCHVSVRVWSTGNRRGMYVNNIQKMSKTMKPFTDGLKQSPLTHLWCFSILSLLSAAVILKLWSTCGWRHTRLLWIIFSFKVWKGTSWPANVLGIVQFVCLKMYLPFLSLAAMLWLFMELGICSASLESGSQSRIRSLPYSEKLCLYCVPVLNNAVGTMPSSSSSW